jgi:hypothetical protein
MMWLRSVAVAPQQNHGLYMQLAGKAAQRVPGLQMLPVVRLLMAAEVLVMGKHHLDRLTAAERGQLIGLVSKAKGRPKNLSEAEQAQLSAIVQKLEPRVFLAAATDRISPVGVPSPVLNKLAGGKNPKRSDS